MDPTALVMERLAGEWAVFISHVTTFALRGSIVLAVGLAVVVVVASLPSLVGARQPGAVTTNSTAQVQAQAQAVDDDRHADSARLVAPSGSSSRTDTRTDVYAPSARAYHLSNA